MLKLKSGALRNKILSLIWSWKTNYDGRTKQDGEQKNRETENLEDQRKRRKLSDPRSKKRILKKVREEMRRE